MGREAYRIRFSQPPLRCFTVGEVHVSAPNYILRIEVSLGVLILSSHVQFELGIHGLFVCSFCSQYSYIFCFCIFLREEDAAVENKIYKMQFGDQVC